MLNITENSLKATAQHLLSTKQQTDAVDHVAAKDPDI